MIALEDQKILICTPQKCSSTSVTLTLMREMQAHMVVGPQGPWKKFSLNYHEPIGKHTAFNNPCLFLGYKRYLLYREPFDRFVSLWRHYCRFHKKEISFIEFVSFVEENIENPNTWFYTWRMRDVVDEFKPDGIVQYDQLDSLNEIIGQSISFPKYNTTDHESWPTYYNPSLYRRVHAIT